MHTWHLILAMVTFIIFCTGVSYFWIISKKMVKLKLEICNLIGVKNSKEAMCKIYECAFPIVPPPPPTA